MPDKFSPALAVDSHAAFVEKVRRAHLWTITNPRRAFRLAWGLPGELLFWLHHGVCVIAPLLWLAYVSATNANYWLLAWAPMVVWTAFVSSRTVIGLLPSLALAALVGVPLSILLGRDQLLTALSPASAWIVAVMVKAQVARWSRLTRSPEAWLRVSEAGLLREG